MAQWVNKLTLSRIPKCLGQEVHEWEVAPIIGTYDIYEEIKCRDAGYRYRIAFTKR